MNSYNLEIYQRSIFKNVIGRNCRTKIVVDNAKNIMFWNKWSKNKQQELWVFLSGVPIQEKKNDIIDTSMYGWLNLMKYKPEFSSLFSGKI